MTNKTRLGILFPTFEPAAASNPGLVESSHKACLETYDPGIQYQQAKRGRSTRCPTELAVTTNSDRLKPAKHTLTGQMPMSKNGD